MKLFYLLFLTAYFSISVIAQSDKDIIRTRDKYRDIDTLSAKPNDVLARVGKVRTVASMTPIAVIEKTPILYVGLVFSPEAVTVAGSALQSAAANDISLGEIYRSVKSKPGKVYFQPTAEAILLVGNERTNLPPADKIGGFSGLGEYRDQTVAIVPVEWFNKLAASDQWSIKIGDVIVGVGVGDPDLGNAKNAEKWAERVQPRLRLFAEEIRKINATRLAPGKTAMPSNSVQSQPASENSKTESTKKTCYEGGRKVPCSQ